MRISCKKISLGKTLKKAVTAGAIALLAGMSGRSFAQELLLEVRGDPGDYLVPVGLGDVDGDRTPDLAALGYTGPLDEPELRALSGRDGSVIWTVTNVVSYALVALGDVDGDGLCDLLTTEPWDDTAGTDAGAAFVRSGRDGSILRATYGSAAGAGFGTGGAAALDVDGDGVPDSIARDSGHNGKPYHLVVSAGADGSVLLDLSSRAPSWGGSFAGIGDVDGDGHGDIAVGEPHKETGRGLFEAGRVNIYSGKDGSLLAKVDGAVAWAIFGWSIASVGDIDGDGVLDFAAGAPLENRGNDDYVGAAYVISGRDFQVLQRVAGEREYDQFGERLSGLGDVNGDGRPDFGVTAYGASYRGDGSLSAYVFSGATAARLYRFDGRQAEDWLYDIGRARGDADGDGIDDLVLTFADRDPVTLVPRGRAELRGGNDLWLESRPRVVPPGKQVELRTLEGPPGGLTLLALVAVSGTPTFKIVGGFGQFDAAGLRTVGGTVPPGLTGLDFDLRSFAMTSAGVIESAVERIEAR